VSTWNRIACLYIDVDVRGGNPLLDGKTSAPLAAAQYFIQADKFPLQLYFRKRSATTGGTSAATELAATDNIVFSGKETAQITGATPLFTISGFAVFGSGDDLCYQAVLNLDTIPLRAAMTSVPTLAITIDIEVQNADNSERFTFQFTATIKKQAYNGEAIPLPGAPLYPAPNQIMLIHADGASFVFSSDRKHAYVYVEGTGLYHPVIGKLEDGHVVLATSDEGVLNP
jgi:hypothetical protein